MRHPAYPEYKESGVQWLGNVPEHWEVKRLKTSATYKVSNVDKVPKEDELSVRLCNYTDVYYHDNITPDMNLMEATATPEEISRFHLEVEDIIITKDSEDWRDIAIPARVEATSPDLVCGYHLAIISPMPGVLDGRYLLRAFQSSAVNQQFQIAASGVTRYGLPKSSIGGAELPVPPFTEQTSIADFLDRETGRIDRLVAKKRQLIELLKEKRKALVSRTVTRGLPADAAREFGLEPHIRVKASGIDWLGEVPEGWDALPLRRLIRFVKTGNTPSGAEVYHFEEGGFNWYSPSDFSDAVYLGVANRALSAKGEAEVRIFPEMTVMIVGIGATIGKVGLATNECSCNQQINAIICNSKLDPVFATYYLKTMRDFIMKCGKFTTLPIINQDETKNLILTVPPISEQTAIATYLDCETSRTDRLVEKVEAAIECLQEYRTALTTAAVRGKIDVREVLL